LGILSQRERKNTIGSTASGIDYILSPGGRGKISTFPKLAKIGEPSPREKKIFHTPRRGW